MGDTVVAFLKNAIEALDPAPDKKGELTLALNLLFELAEQKSVLFKRDLEQDLRTAGTPDNPTIPVTAVLGWHNETRAYVKDDAGKLAGVVTDSVKKFISGGTGEIVDGIGELATGALEAILGAGSGTQTEMHSYFIVVEGLSIVRVDIAGWSRRIEATGITTKIESALAFQAVKSSINVDAITFNTFLQAYKAQLEKLTLPPAELKAFILEAKEVFELLRDPSGSAVEGAISGDVGLRRVADGREFRPPGETQFLIDGAAVSGQP